ncbi:MAG TPA: hypothetical protein IAA30_03990 [Candidatus Treponema faecavium]|nr:hypothetical protein [Candidatus Treponema faecavium]
MQALQKYAVCLCLICLWAAVPAALAQQAADGTTEAAPQDTAAQNIKQELSAAAESVRSWVESRQQKNAAAETEPETAQKGSLRALAYVQDIKRGERLLYVLYEDGTAAVVQAADSTIVRRRKAEEGLLYPFTGDSTVSFDAIHRGDWIRFSYTVSDYLKSLIPGTTDALSAVEIDILR